MSRFVIVVFTIFLARFSADGGVQTNVPIFSFVADGDITVDRYGHSDLAPIIHTEGKFTFTYSNSVWEIQVYSQKGNVPGIDQAKFSNTVIYCKRIQDGIRYYVTSATNGNKSALPVAQAVPIAFPPPDQNSLFACWLTLCPNPELPIVDLKSIRRFLSTELFKNTNNIGKYFASYLDAGPFLSTLSITNNGVEFISETEILKQDVPFKDGYLEFAYQVLATTNINGLTLPIESVTYEYSTKEKATKNTDVYPVLVFKLKIQKITPTTEVLFSEPKQLVAMDRRPGDLPNGKSVNYVVKNDKWAATNDRQLVKFAETTRQLNLQVSNKNNHQTARTVICIVLFITLVSPLGIFLWKSKGNSK
jgi:hypothetical protein